MANRLPILDYATTNPVPAYIPPFNPPPTGTSVGHLLTEVTLTLDAETGDHIDAEATPSQT